MNVSKGKTVAQIAVFLPLRQSFAYSFSESDREKLKPGVRVVAPFRNRDEVGVFTGFSHSDIKTKKIKYILDDAPIFPPHLIKVVEWCAEYYIAGVGELFRMIGPRESLKRKVAYSRTDKSAEKISGIKKAIYNVLEKPVAAATLAKKAGLTVGELEKKIRQLVKDGLVKKEAQYYFAASRLDPLDWGELYAAGKKDKVITPGKYTGEQNAAVSGISSEIDKRSGKTTLLYGVTGSGKTEVYLALCKKALDGRGGGGAIVLVPEIALTFQLVRRFFSRFGNAIAVLHSGLTPAQRRDEWMRIQRGDARIVIGARSAIFAPMKNLRLIVVDEENDQSYKQTESPHYNARDVAVVTGNISGAAVVLGSATPSLETFHNAQSGKYSVFRLSRRVDNLPMPKVKVLTEDTEDMQKNLGKKILPTQAMEKILKGINAGEQSLIFINRRGAASYLRCRACGHIAGCPNCDVTLTYHSSSGKLLCHYCGYALPEPAKCEECKIGNTYKYNGIGTQKVESFLREVFPKATVGRLDQDAAPTREKAFAILDRFECGKTDILVGTQMTAKGHDFENLTFTAIVGADDYLNFPDFRSAERTFALVTQAAGRTGRGKKGGEVVITGAGDHYAIRCAVDHDYDAFFKAEISRRKDTGYPPFTRLIGMSFESNSQKRLEGAMKILGEKLDSGMSGLSAGVTVLGPVPALIYKVRNRYRWKLLLKGVNSKNLHDAAVLVANAAGGAVNVSIDVDPVGFF
ncbi:MAG: primosomal protein N' [Nitrospinota bacterium]